MSRQHFRTVGAVRGCWRLVPLALLLVAFSATSASAQSYGTGSAGGSVDPGKLWGWGLNNNAQLGDATTIDRNAPIRLAGNREFVQLRSGDRHTVALASDGTVWTWGQNTFGKLGDGTTTGSDTPIKVPSLSNIVAVAAGEDHSMALRGDGAVLAWGDSVRGQVGNLSANPITTPVTVLQNAVAIAAGVDSSMAIGRDGAVWVWGENANGQLAVNPSLTGNQFKNQPQKLSTFGIGNPNGPARAIAQGCGSSYVLDQDGDIWAWGSNQFGQVVPAATTPATVDFTPNEIPDFADGPITAITAGCGFAGALDDSGDVWTWGRADDGRLGTAAVTNDVPTEVTLDGVTAISAAEASMFAVTNENVLFAWGDDDAGTIGNGLPLADENPGVEILQLLEGVAGVGTGADGQQAFAIGRAKALVTPDDVHFGTTSPVGGATPQRTISVYNNGADALNVSSVSLFDGDADQFEITSDTCTDNPLAPADTCHVAVRFAPVANGPSVALLRIVGDGPQAVHLVRLDAFGVGFAPLSSAPGPLYAWGSNDQGQLGDLSFVQRDSPVPVAGEAVALATGSRRSYALHRDGTVWGWGNSSPFDMFGVYAGDVSLTQTRVEGINAVTDVAAGENHTLALRTDGTVWGWGDGGTGQLGHAPIAGDTPVPVLAAGVTDVVAIAAGEAHSLAVKRDGSVMAWGSNSNGQIGALTLGSSSNVPATVSTAGFVDIVDVAAGAAHSVALKGDGTVWTWGSDASGQLGDGTSSGSSITPTQVGGITNAVAVGAGAEHTVVLLADGTVRAFGEGDAGQLGNGPSSDSAFPVTPTITDVVDVAVGAHHALARRTDGTVHAWGAGLGGQIGDGAASNAVTPTQVAVVDHGGGPFGEGSAANHSLMIGRSHMGLVSAAKMVFPTVLPGRVTDALTAIVVNDGAAPMTMGTAEIVASTGGPDADQFKISGDGCSGQTLGPQQSCRIGVRFTPIVTDPLVPATPIATPVAHLRVPSDAANSPVMVEVDPPPPAGSPAASGGGGSTPAAVAGESRSSSSPSLAAAVRKAVTVKRANATCTRARAGKRVVRLSCRLAGQKKGRRLSVRLTRGKVVYASGSAKLARGKAVLRLKAKRRVKRGLYTAVVSASGAGAARTVATLRVLVR